MYFFKEAYFEDKGSSFLSIDPIFKEFIKKYHYSKSIRGIATKHIFVLGWRGRLMGVCVVGKPAGHKYNGTNTVEIRRFCTVDDAPKNASSFFLGKVLKYLKKNTDYKTVISFADPFHQHKGIIYKASNFTYKGRQKYTPVAYIVGGKKMHQRNFKQVTSKGNLTKNSQIIRSGKAERVLLPKKHIYTYELKR